MNIKLPLLFAWEWKYQGKCRQFHVCGVSRFRTKPAGLCILGSSAGFTTPRWCDPGLVTSSLWTSGSLSFPVLISSCLSCSVDAMQSEIKLSNITLVKSLGTVIRSQGRIGFVLSRANSSLCDYSDLLLLLTSPASPLWLGEREESGQLNRVTARHFL